MTYSHEILIDRPRDKVVALFADPEEAKNWQPGLISIEPISGPPGQEGSKSRLRFKMGKGEMEMTETILTRRLPEEFHGVYDAPGVHNIVRNYFHEAGPDRTRLVSENVFEFSGLFMKIIAFLMPGSFKKQSMEYAQLFKKLCESR